MTQYNFKIKLTGNEKLSWVVQCMRLLRDNNIPEKEINNFRTVVIGSGEDHENVLDRIKTFLIVEGFN